MDATDTLVCCLLCTVVVEWMGDGEWRSTATTHVRTLRVRQKRYKNYAFTRLKRRLYTGWKEEKG